MDPKRLDHFKERFVDALKVAIAVYRDADVEINPTGVSTPSSPVPIFRLACRHWLSR